MPADRARGHQRCPHRPHRAGGRVSPSLLHYHFASRDALLAEALEHSYELAGTIRIGPDDEPAPAAARLQTMIDQCLPAAGSLRDDWLLWVELWLHAAAVPNCARPPRSCTRACTTGSARRSRRAWRRGEFTVDRPRATVDRLLALIDGYGIRALTDDPAMPIERAREEIWASVATDLGVAG